MIQQETALVPRATAAWPDIELIIGLATRHRFDVAGEPCSSYIQKKRKYRHALNP